MAKPFLLGVECTEESLGRMMRRMHTVRGFIRVHFNMPPPLPDSTGDDGEPRPARGVYGKSGRALAGDLLLEHGPKSVRELGAMFAKEGRSSKSISSVIHAMKAAGEIQPGQAAGTWALTKKMRDRLRARQTNGKATPKGGKRKK